MQQRQIGVVFRWSVLQPEGHTAVASAACSWCQLGQDWDRQSIKPLAATRFTRRACSTFKVSKLIDKLSQAFIKIKKHYPSFSVKLRTSISTNDVCNKIIWSLNITSQLMQVVTICYIRVTRDRYNVTSDFCPGHVSGHQPDWPRNSCHIFASFRFS